jgi:(p)ppGpp synthase/HD superfamily hydrolase
MGLPHIETRNNQSSLEQGRSFLSREYLQKKFGEDVTTYEYFPEDCRGLRVELYTLAQEHKENPYDIRNIELAEKVMFESLEWMVRKGKKRKDGKSLASHLYEVTIAGLKDGVSVSKAPVGLMHDAIEDTRDDKKGLSITEAMIADLFDAHTARSVFYLSKLKSTKDNKNLPLGTHTNLYALIEHDPEVIIFKVEDRLHYLKTSEKMARRKVISKARETMDYYVPLATGLGLHDLAYQLTELSVQYLVSRKKEITFPFGTQEYKNAVDLIMDAIEAYRENEESVGIDRVDSRLPNVADAYRMMRGSLTEIDHAWLPAYVTVVMRDSEKKSVSSTDDRFFHIALPLMFRLKDSGIITDDELRRFMAMLRTGVQRTTHIDILQNNTPVRLRFIGHSEDIAWRSSILDLKLPWGDNVERSEAVARKVGQLKEIYQYFESQAELTGGKLLTMVKECLNKGTTAAFTHIETYEGEMLETSRRVVLPSHATVLDMAFLYAGDHAVYTEGIERKMDNSWHTVPIGAEVEPDAEYRILLGRQERPAVELLDEVATGYGVEQVQMILRNYFKDPQRREDTMQVLIDRGEKVISRLFEQYARQQGDFEAKLSTHIGIADSILQLAHSRYGFRSTNPHDRTLNFLLRTGMKELFIDPGQTSLVWRVVKTIYAYQAKRHTIEIPVIDKKGVLYEITGKFLESDVNIAGIVSQPEYRLGKDKRNARIKIVVDPKEYERFMKVDPKRKRPIRRKKDGTTG